VVYFAKPDFCACVVPQRYVEQMEDRTVVAWPPSKSLSDVMKTMEKHSGNAPKDWSRYGSFVIAANSKLNSN
jgi:hypothetical protein